MHELLPRGQRGRFMTIPTDARQLLPGTGSGHGSTRPCTVCASQGRRSAPAAASAV